MFSVRKTVADLALTVSGKLMDSQFNVKFQRRFS